MKLAEVLTHSVWLHYTTTTTLGVVVINGTFCSSQEKVPTIWPFERAQESPEIWVQYLGATERKDGWGLAQSDTLTQSRKGFAETSRNSKVIGIPQSQK